MNEIPDADIEFTGVGSAGFEGTGWEKRGDRRGTYGSGVGEDMYGGRVFGSYTRSTVGASRAIRASAPTPAASRQRLVAVRPAREPGRAPVAAGEHTVEQRRPDAAKTCRDLCAW